MRAIGCILAQRLTTALTGLGIDFATIQNIVYAELAAIGHEQNKGDWIALPDGTTYEMTFKARKTGTFEKDGAACK